MAGRRLPTWRVGVFVVADQFVIADANGHLVAETPIQHFVWRAFFLAGQVGHQVTPSMFFVSAPPRFNAVAVKSSVIAMLS